MDAALLVFFGLCFLTATGGGIFRPGRWYETLRHPAWRPPNYVFAPVWIVLFVLIAISGWLVWRDAGGSSAGQTAMTVYGLQLVLNFLWSALFFGMRRPGLALLEMSLLWISIAILIWLFAPINTLAAMLLVPYLLWVSFAFALNYTLWSLNRGKGSGELSSL
ncbi:MAG: TspO/MBR family protein [Pseudomonadota bacterium]